MNRGTLVITGVDGFVGAHVAEAAVRNGWRVVGMGLHEEPRAELAPLLAEYETVDLTQRFPAALKPDAVIHLAGLSRVGQSFAEPQRFLQVNSAMVTTMCEALLDRGGATRVLGVSSGAVYASSAVGTRSEDSDTAPSSPYVVSKLLVEQQLGYYALRGLDTIVARPFNHIGPGQGPGFILPDVVAQLTAWDGAQALRTGDLTTERDYTDVRDIAAAYLTLIEAREHRHRIYNVASGRSISGRRLLELACSAMGRPVPATEVDPARVRPTDPQRITGSAARLAAEHGWHASVPIEQTVADFIAAAPGNRIGEEQK